MTSDHLHLPGNAGVLFCLVLGVYFGSVEQRARGFKVRLCYFLILRSAQLQLVISSNSNRLFSILKFFLNFHGKFSAFGNVVQRLENMNEY